MTTLERESVSSLTQAATIDATLLNELVTGALVGADKSKSATSNIGSIYLSIDGGDIVVKATDRYRLVMGSAYVGIDPLSECQILVADAKRILTLLKENKAYVANMVTLSRVGELLTISMNGSAITINLMGNKFPDVSNLFKSSEPISSLSLNAELLGSFAKVPSSAKDSQIYLDFMGERKAIKIKVPHDTIEWECALMPMKDNR